MRKPQKRVCRLSLCRPEPCTGGSGGIHEDRRLYSKGNLKQILTGFVFNQQTVWIMSDGWVLIDTCGFEFDCGTVGPSLDRVSGVRACVWKRWLWLSNCSEGLKEGCGDVLKKIGWCEERVADACGTRGRVTDTGMTEEQDGRGEY
ncbi:hypothetical protein F2Q70_00019446 [Brassica cretica]|uniref:Uncharacterized protein n=1 Tax=Brassica cretica TaxID=69181 RepID=A0A8S9GKR7_BRACR|nr:hypothetical protein F2Q70_00019446 [Brassica cretica]